MEPSLPDGLPAGSDRLASAISVCCASSNAAWPGPLCVGHPPPCSHHTYHTHQSHQDSQYESTEKNQRGHDHNHLHDWPKDLKANNTKNPKYPKCDFDPMNGYKSTIKLCKSNRQPWTTTWQMHQNQQRTCPGIGLADCEKCGETPVQCVDCPPLPFPDALQQAAL